VPIKGIATGLGLPVHEIDTFTGWQVCLDILGSFSRFFNADEWHESPHDPKAKLSILSLLYPLVSSFLLASYKALNMEV
jgi:hypothetical protein